MKRIVLSFTVAAAVLASAALPASGQTGASGQQQKPAQKPAQAGQSDTHQFITTMANVNMAEIQLGKLAEQHASSSDVKQFGQMMVKDHTQANNELKQVASQMKVQMPSQLDAKHKQLADKLSKLKGAEFDREYISAMVQGHKQAISDVKAHTKGGSETVGTTGDKTGAQAVTQWATKTLPTLEKHLDRAEQIQQKLGK